MEYSVSTIMQVSGAIVHQIKENNSLIPLASGHFCISKLKKGSSSDSEDVYASVGDTFLCPLWKHGTLVEKMDVSHYLFELVAPDSTSENYDLAFVFEGQEKQLAEQDLVLEQFTEFKSANKPNRNIAKMITEYSEMASKLILRCGDGTVDHLKCANELLKKKIVKGTKVEVDPEALRGMQQAKEVAKVAQEATTSLVSSISNAPWLWASSFAKSNLLRHVPEEIIDASFDAMNKISDAVQVAGKNVGSTASDATRELLSQRYGGNVATMTEDALFMAGNVFVTAWTISKLGFL